MNVNKELAALRKMPMPGLKARYAELFGELTRSNNRDFLVRRVIWRMQAQAEGGFEERIKRIREKAMAIANDADLRTTPPRSTRPPHGAYDTNSNLKFLKAHVPGALPGGGWITRDYKGKTIRVKILPKGFEYEGEEYRSLSAVAKAVTGTHWNGWLFFGVKPQGTGRASA